MSSTAVADADAIPVRTPEDTEKATQTPDIVKANHDLPARTMAEPDDEHHEGQEKDDPATVAAREELKHTTISEKTALESEVDPTMSPIEPSEDQHMEETAKAHTPEAEPSDAQDEEMREQLSSPKKKRGRDQDDEIKDIDDVKVDAGGTTIEGTTLNGNRTTRLEPEKKRHRDTSEDPSKATDKGPEMKDPVGDSSETTNSVASSIDASKKFPELPSKPTFGSAFNDKPQTSPSAFARSGFGSLAGSSTSPFGTLGATKPSVFGGNTQQTLSGFGGLTRSKSPIAATTVPTSALTSLSSEKSNIGFGAGFGGSSSSGFGALSGGVVFGSNLGNGFASGAGQKLSSFAAAGKENVTATTKPAKPFGAPDSDGDKATDDDDSEGNANTDDEEGGKIAADEKKKVKVTKVPVEDGEAGEVTLLSLRAKLFSLESKEAGWKERGVGTLKVNVNKDWVEIDDITGLPMPETFGKPAAGDDVTFDSAPIARLIMRQENTYRVILNTIIVPAMEFKDKPSTTTAQILFTAFEGEKAPKPVNMLLKMSEVNARSFKSAIENVQHNML